MRFTPLSFTQPVSPPPPPPPPPPPASDHPSLARHGRSILKPSLFVADTCVNNAADCNTCATCTSVIAGTYCASWCNDYTCAQGLCGGCSACDYLTSATPGKRCLGWQALLVVIAVSGSRARPPTSRPKAPQWAGPGLPLKTGALSERVACLGLSQSNCRLAWLPGTQVQHVHVWSGRLRQLQRHGRLPELLGPIDVLRGLVILLGIEPPSLFVVVAAQPLSAMPPHAGATHGRAIRHTARAAPPARRALARPRGRMRLAPPQLRHKPVAQTATATPLGIGATWPRSRAPARLPLAETGSTAALLPGGGWSRRLSLSRARASWSRTGPDCLVAVHAPCLVGAHTSCAACTDRNHAECRLVRCVSEHLLLSV